MGKTVDSGSSLDRTHRSGRLRRQTCFWRTSSPCSNSRMTISGFLSWTFPRSLSRGGRSEAGSADLERPLDVGAQSDEVHRSPLNVRWSNVQ